jgi:pyruvate dehydrogenase E2 component (dihydrolipoamide acetyltransferase)
LVTAVVMPQLGLEVVEGTVLDIQTSVGAQVRRDDVLVELETDKATTEVVAPCDGVVQAVHVAVGDTVAVGAVLIDLAGEGDDAPTPVSAAAPEAETAPVASAPAPAPAAAPVAANGNGSAPRLRAAPVARRAATRLGIDLAAVSGTGPRGRITLGDVEQAAASGPPPAAAPAAPAAPAPDGAVDEPLTGLRRAIARRMTASQRIPQYELQRDLDVRHLLAQKDALAAAGGKARPGVNDLLLQAIAEMVVRHPALATTLVTGEDGAPVALRRRPGADVGLAVATDRGLVVPVIRDAHVRGAAEIAAERGRLVAAARAGTLGLEEMTGGTITLSNLGGFGIDRFKAMVNPGEAAIVAVGRTTDRVVARGRGIDVVPMLTLTMTFDHRVIDGAVGAEALSALADLLEGAMTWRP